MKLSRSLIPLLAPLFVIPLLAVYAFAADQGVLLTGKWKMTTPARDASGAACPFVPESMEFFGDGTMTMSNMPGNRLPFKTNLIPDEKRAMETRDAALKGKNLLLVKPMPQMEWSSTPIVYSFTATKKELRITVTGWTPATFQRMK